MTGVVASLAAGMVIAGVFTVVAGLSPVSATVRTSGLLIEGIRRRWLRWPRALRVRAGLGVVGGVVAVALTGFVPALVLVPTLVVILPALLANQPQPELNLLEALDRWIRVLAASVGTGKSVSDAIHATVVQTPPLLTQPVRDLARRLDDRWTLGDALQQMADEVDSPDADAVLAALILIGQRGGVGASVTLDALSDSLQDRLRAMREISAERAKPQVVVRQVTMITLVAIGAGFIFSPSYFAPFRTPLGQLLMVVLGLIYLGSLFALRRIATPRRRERILVRVASREPAHA